MSVLANAIGATIVPITLAQIALTVLSLASGTARQTQPTVLTEEENAAMSAFSAEYSAGLNGSGPVNKFHHAKGRDLDWTKAGLRDFFRYADPSVHAGELDRAGDQGVRAHTGESAPSAHNVQPPAI
jgi:hypothetical protein